MRRRKSLRIICRVSLVLSLALATAGCRLWSPEPSSDVPFMELWKIYSHCQTTQDLESLLRDAAQLTRYAERPEQELPRLLRPMRALISPPVVRVSVDPKAMASACTLRAAEAATNAGWTDVAIRLYRSILPSTTIDGEPTYYAREAEAGLADAVLQQQEQMPNPALTP